MCHQMRQNMKYSPSKQLANLQPCSFLTNQSSLGVPHLHFFWTGGFWPTRTSSNYTIAYQLASRQRKKRCMKKTAIWLFCSCARIRKWRWGAVGNGCLFLPSLLWLVKAGRFLTSVFNWDFICLTIVKNKKILGGKKAFKRTWVWLLLLLSSWWHSLHDCTLNFHFLGGSGEPGCLLQYKRFLLHNHSNKDKVKFKDFRDLSGWFIMIYCRI